MEKVKRLWASGQDGRVEPVTGVCVPLAFACTEPWVACGNSPPHDFVDRLARDTENLRDLLLVPIKLFEGIADHDVF